MIWHIFKKDLKLTWPLAAAVAAVHWTTTAVTLDVTARVPPNLPKLLAIGGLIATGFVIMTAVQQDAIPGVRQDWLIRPIRRRDLMLAKLLFVVLMVQLPIFLADITASLVSGFSLLPAVTAALQRSLIQMLVVNLPFLAFASITRNLLEVLTGGVALGLAVAIVNVLTSGVSSLEPVARTGLQWMIAVASFGILILGAALVLVFQYCRRRSVVARVLTAGITALCLLTAFLPWRPAFAFQKSLSNAPGSSRDIALDFEPKAGRFHPPAGGLTLEDAVAILKRGEGLVQVYLPFRVTGLPLDSAVEKDRSEVRLVDTNGRTERLQMDQWDVRREAADSPTQTVYPPISIPAALYKRIKDQPVNLEIDSWLTLVQVVSSYALPAIGGDQHISGLGMCRTTVNDQETAVQLRCMEAGSPWRVAPACLGFFLEHLPTAQRNPDRFSCRTWSPFFPDDPVGPDPLWRNGASLPFRDSSGLAHYPVDGSKLRESRAVIQVYRAQDHFIRNVVIPEVRLGEWEAETPDR